MACVYGRSWCAMILECGQHWHLSLGRARAARALQARGALAYFVRPPRSKRGQPAGPPPLARPPPLGTPLASLAM